MRRCARRSPAISALTATGSSRPSPAEDALAALRGGHRPGLLILDINLPGETGWALLRDPALAAAGSPPVVVATATAINPSRLREFNVAGYLPKPFPLETLVSTIERLLLPKEAQTRDD